MAVNFIPKPEHCKCVQFECLIFQLAKVSSDVPSEIEKAISSVQSATDKVKFLGEQQDSLRHSALDHVRDLEKMTQEMERLTVQVLHLEKHSKYLAYVARVEELRYSVI